MGIIGFGGGSALIPVIEKEVVKKIGSIDPDDYTKHAISAVFVKLNVWDKDKKHLISSIVIKMLHSLFLFLNILIKYYLFRVFY